MTLLKLAFAAATGYGLYRLVRQQKGSELTHPAFAEGESVPGNFTQVRNAGPAGMRSDPPEWDHTDEASDESFPASDPPAIPRAR